MTLSDVSIRRPVFATVLNLLILVVGAFSFRALPIREYPDIDMPVVSISTVYYGASPETIESSVTEPIEQTLNGIEDIRAITSSSAQSVSTIRVEFQAGRDIDQAATDVSNVIQQALGQLPLEAEKPVVTKADAASQAMMWIGLMGDDWSLVDRTDMAERLVKTPLQLLPGVARVLVGGERRYAMRVWLDPVKMAARGVEPGDVRRAIRENNVQAPAGDLLGTSRKFTLNVDARIDDPKVFERLVLRRDGNQVVRLQDVGWVELGAENYRSISRGRGRPTVSVGIVRQSTANELEVSRAVRAALPVIERSLPKGVTLESATDNSIFVEASLREAVRTLLIAFVLVVLVNLVFLRSALTTIITSVSIPISLVGALAAMAAMGFSLNVLTVLGLILAIGLLVDDSIVVLENIYRRQEHGEPPRRAALNGTKEVAFPVIATTASVVAVLLPLATIAGNTGRLFREFAWTMAAAISISMVVSLTAVPMACSLFLRLSRKHGRLWNAVERALDASLHGYQRGLQWSLGRRLLVLGFVVLMMGGSWWLLAGLPRTLVPTEDRGSFITFLRAPQGATAAYTDQALRQAERAILEVPEVISTFAAVALGFGGPSDTASGLVFTRLKHWDERSRSQQEIVGQLFGRFMAIPEALVFPINPSSLGQSSRSADVQLVLKSTAATLDELDAATSALLQRARDIPGLINVDSDLRLDNPQLDIRIDRERTADLGVPVLAVADALRLLVSESPADQFVLRNKQYDVVTALAASQRSVPEQLGEIHLRGEGGVMVPLSNLVTAVPAIKAASLNHYDLQRSATLTANLAPGATLGAVLTDLRQVTAEVLPPGYTTALGGVSREYVESSGAVAFSFGLALLVIYLVLAAQFESFVHPLTVMLSVPLATFGALGTLWASGHTLNIYSAIGLILLIGLVTKNAILLVDFANQERARGTALLPAVALAGRTRFRPILMTSLTAILGAVPLALASGAGAESRRPIGAALVGGLSFSTAFTLLVIPALYVLVVALAERIGLNTIPPLVELKAEDEENARPEPLLPPHATSAPA